MHRNALVCSRHRRRDRRARAPPAPHTRSRSSIGACLMPICSQGALGGGAAALGGHTDGRHAQPCQRRSSALSGKRDGVRATSAAAGAQARHGRPAQEAHNGELRSSAVSSSGGRGGDGAAGACARCTAVGVRRIGAESRTELRDRPRAPGVITNRDLRCRSRQPIRLAGSLHAPISPSASHRAFSEAQIPTASRHARSFQSQQKRSAAQCKAGGVGGTVRRVDGTVPWSFVAESDQTG